MRLDQSSPVFRRTLVPWYDSEAACLLTLIFLFLVFLFGMAGISVANEVEEYRDHLWVPVLLVAMSAGVIVSITIRLINRYLIYRSERRES
jgi:hypothetical protein